MSRHLGPARRIAVTLAALALGLGLLPRQICGHDAGAYFAGEREVQDRLARAAVRTILDHQEEGRTFYHTGAERFDGQSAVAIYQMTILGLGQIVREHPELRDAYLPAMRAAADRLVDPKTLRYAARVWGGSGLDRMRPGEGHAYLGYVNMALGMLRAVDPATPHAALNDRLTEAFAERLGSAPTGLIETYPGETWPPDVAAVAGSIGLHDQVTGTDRHGLLARWAERFDKCAVHKSGYLVQRVRSGSCKPLDAPRGSGTAIASYFIGFADAPLSRRLYDAIATRGRISWLGFAGVREYAPGFKGKGDLNAGPMVLGASVGATGYALGAARAHGDLEFYRELFRSVTLAGVPSDTGGGATRFATGGALGNALLLAMLTANPVSQNTSGGETRK